MALPSDILHQSSSTAFALHKITFFHIFKDKYNFYRDRDKDKDRWHITLLSDICSHFHPCLLHYKAPCFFWWLQSKQAYKKRQRKIERQRQRQIALLSDILHPVSSLPFELWSIFICCPHCYCKMCFCKLNFSNLNLSLTLCTHFHPCLLHYKTLLLFVQWMIGVQTSLGKKALACLHILLSGNTG